MLKLMGVDIEYNKIKTGFSPFGGGKVILDISPCSCLKPIVLSKRGEIKEVKIFSNYNDDDHFEFHKKLVEKVKAKLKSDYPKVLFKDIPEFFPKIEKRKRSHKCRGTEIIVSTINGSVLCIEKSWTSKGEESIEVDMEVILEKLNDILENDKVSVDEFRSDQLLIYMALAKGESIITIKEVTMHFKTLCHIIPKFFKDAEIDIIPQTDEKCGDYYKVKVMGIGYNPM